MPTSGGGTTNTVQKSDPWSGAQPYLTDLMSKAQSTYDASQGNNQLPNTYAGQGPITQAALGMTANRAVNGSPLVATADQSLQNILGQQSSPGTSALQGLLDPNSQANASAAQFANPNNINPYLNAQFSAESQPVIDAVNGQAGMAGRTGSGAQQQLLTRNLGQLANQIYAPAYENAANRSLSAGNQLGTMQANAANSLNANQATQNQQKIQASISAPNLAGQDYADLQNLLNVGGAQDQNSQSQLNSILQQFQYSQQQPWNILSNYAGAISGLGGLGGSSNSSTTQPSQSALPSLIGTGLSILPFLL
jgi:hypothetical protein